MYPGFVSIFLRSFLVAASQNLHAGDDTFGNVDTLLVCFGPFHFIGGECGGTATELRTLFSKIGIQHSKFS